MAAIDYGVFKGRPARRGFLSTRLTFGNINGTRLGALDTVPQDVPALFNMKNTTN